MHNKKETTNKEAAVISGTTRYLFFVVISITIRAIDNVEHKSLLSNKVRVFPGFHKITVEYVLINNTFKESANVDLSFTAEAGREYKIKEEASFIIVIDTTTGEVVAKQPLNGVALYKYCWRSESLHFFRTSSPTRDGSPAGF